MPETHAHTPSDARKRPSWREEWRTDRAGILLAVAMLAFAAAAAVWGAGR